MKKVLLTAAIIFSGLCVSAQNFLVTVGIEKDANDEYSGESLTNNLGFGYMINDNFMGGLTMTDATNDAVADDAGDIANTIEADMQLFVRYYYNENLFLSVTTPWGTETEDVSAMDMMRLGAGYSVNVCNNINVEAGYSMLTSTDANDDRKGEFKVGLSVSF